MKNKYLTLLLLFVSFVAISTMPSCKKDKPAAGTDLELLNMAKEPLGFTWYKNSSALLNKSAGSGHNEPFLKTKYNDIASAMLDTNGKVLPNSVFPEGSLVVKQLYSDANTLGRYAILYKKAGDANADANGWVWGYINADGTVAEPASNKGSACRTCHLQNGNIDYMLMNAYFP